MVEYGTLAARISADFRFREKLCKDKRSEHKSGVKGVEKRDTRFLFSEIRSAPRPHLKANSTRATLLFRNNGNVKLTATGN